MGLSGAGEREARGPWRRAVHREVGSLGRWCPWSGVYREVRSIERWVCEEVGSGRGGVLGEVGSADRWVREEVGSVERRGL